jgi:hypothetical protein
MKDSLERSFALTPYDPSEALTLQRAAERAGVQSTNTIKGWCKNLKIGRLVGGRWKVSRVALEMYLDGNCAALKLYLAGNRESEAVVSYFRQFGIKPQKQISR